MNDLADRRDNRPGTAALPGPLASAYPLATRVILFLAAMAVVPSVLAIVILCVGRDGLIAGGFRAVVVLSTVGITLATIAIWWAAVRWTLGRSAATALVAAVPLAQAIWSQTLWNAGCEKDVLQFGQDNATFGIWVWLSVWVWWGLAKIGPCHAPKPKLAVRRTIMSPLFKRLLTVIASVPIIVLAWWVLVVVLDEDVGLSLAVADVISRAFAAGAVFTVWVVARRLIKPHSPAFRRHTMTPMARRLVLGIGLLPLTFGLWWIAAVFCHDRLSLSDEPAAALANLFCMVVNVVLWIAVWRKAVTWTAGTIVKTALCVAAIIAVVGPCPWLPDEPEWVNVCGWWLPCVMWGLWMACSAYIWPMRASQSLGSVEESLRCGECNYSLIGLTSTRCPECGHQPTLEQLWTRIVAVDVD